MVIAENLTYSYGEVKLSFPDFQLGNGECLAIIGPSGSGKTTLLQLLSGINKIQQGKISIKGTDISTLNSHQLDRFRGQNIGIVFQRAHLINALTVRENLLTTQYLAGESQSNSRINEVLGELNLSEKIDSKPHELSQGEGQRVAIARAVINKPSLILADEPTSSLDDDNCMKVLNLLIQEAKHYQAALIVVTHDQRVKDQISQNLKMVKQS